VAEADVAAAPAEIVVALTSYNDARTIGAVARAVRDGLAHDFGARATRIVLADAGSTDGTREAARAALGRGGLVDEEALADLLERGHLAGCALDTYNVEPPGATIDRLRRHPRTLLLPHIGAQTREGQIRVGMELVDSLAKAVKRFMANRAAALAAAKDEAAAAEAAATADTASGEGAPEPGVG